MNILAAGNFTDKVCQITKEEVISLSYKLFQKIKSGKDYSIYFIKSEKP
jgi:hypothetical protein